MTMPGVTNPAEPFFKDGSWGWDGTVWRKLQMVWGYSDRYAELVTDFSPPAGFNILAGTVVPAGEVWVVQAMGAVDTTSAISNVLVCVYSGTVDLALGQIVTPVANQECLWTGEVTMKAGDRARALFDGVILNDDLYFKIWGYKMKVAE